MNLNDTSVETSTSADSLAEQEATPPQESTHVTDKTIHVKPEPSSASSYSWPPHISVTSVPVVTAHFPCVEESARDSTIHVSNGNTAISQDTIPNYVASPPTLALQERNPRKR